MAKRHLMTVFLMVQRIVTPSGNTTPLNGCNESEPPVAAESLGIKVNRQNVEISYSFCRKMTIDVY